MSKQPISATIGNQSLVLGTLIGQSQDKTQENRVPNIQNDIFVKTPQLQKDIWKSDPDERD